ncbi:MAG: flagellar filament capping protein FliD [Rhodanobacteraceae bacterium]
MSSTISTTAAPTTLLASLPLSSSPTSGTLSSPGIGSGLDVTTLVQELVAAATQGQTTLLTNQQSNVQAEISAIATIQSAASTLNGDINTLTTVGTSQRSVDVSDSSVLSASAADGTPLGAYTVTVDSLAQGQVLTSSAFASSTAAVGSGTLTLTSGSNSFSVDLSTDASLSQIADAINSSADNTSITASVVNASDGAHLVLASNQTGTANAITVAASGGDGGLDALQYGNGASGGLSQFQAASDAQLTIDGSTVTSSSNVVDDAIQGVTLNLAAAAPGEAVTVTVGEDTTALSTAVAKFVSDYNAFNAAITQQTSYDSSTNSASPLLGDIEVSLLQQKMENLAGGSLASGPFTTLSQIGITVNTDGTLSLDQTALTNALTQNPGAVGDLLTGSAGIATQMQSQLTNALAFDGLFADETNGFQSQLTSVQQQQQAVQNRAAQLTQMYTTQFSALDTLMTQMQSTSSYLTSALANLPTISSSNSNGNSAS